MPMDGDPLDLFVRSLTAAALRADDGDRVTRRTERARFLPHSPVEGTRQVLDDDQDSTGFSRAHAGARSTKCTLAMPAARASQAGRCPVCGRSLGLSGANAPWMRQLQPLTEP